MITKTAQAAVDLSAQFTTSFATVRVQGDCERVAVLHAPKEMSTGGGVRARQPLTLESMTNEGPAVVIGWVNLGNYTAGLRTYARLAVMHRERFDDQPYPLDKESYDRLFDLAHKFFAEYGLPVEVEDYLATAGPKTIKPKGPTPAWLLVLISVLGAALFTAIWYFLQ